MSRFLSLVSLALVLSACSSDTRITAPGPDPVTGPAHVASVTIADPGIIRDGDAVPLQVTVRDQRGAPFSAATIIWTVSDPLIATVSSGGLLTGLREGQLDVIATATSGGHRVQTRRLVSITLHPATAIELSRTDLELPMGQTGGAAVTLRGLDGRVLLNRPIQWTSDNPIVADVSQNGIITPRSGGTARIIARYGTLTATLRVTVPTPPPASERYAVTRFNGLALPGVLSRVDERQPDGSTRFEITQLDSGTVTIGSTYQVRLYLTTKEGWEMGGNTIVRNLGRTTVRDDGIVSYDWFTQNAHFASTFVGGLSHLLRPINGIQTLTFREPGTNNSWNLGLTRSAR